MKIIISPAKKMKQEQDFLEYQNIPIFLEETEKLRKILRAMPTAELKQLLQCNDSIAALNYDRYQAMNLTHNLSPAILSYDGIQYQYMAPQVFEAPYFAYIEQHLRILSGFYGILRPFDGIVPYRLEMQAKLKTQYWDNLYSFWGDRIYRELTQNESVILDLASKEYSKVVKKYRTQDIRWISCIFGEYENGKIVEKGVHVKMARGEMVRFMAEHAISDPDEIKLFQRLGYSYQESLSNREAFVFIKQKSL